MNKVSLLEDVDEFVKLWPRLAKLALAPCPHLEADDVLCTFLKCFDQGAVFVVRNEHGLVGSCCVRLQDESAILLSLPEDNGLGLAKSCLEAVREWADAQHCYDLRVTTTRLSGSSYRYFEKSLGFRRRAVTFAMEI
jgi:GNAT superfamily N-acetyltransferase